MSKSVYVINLDSDFQRMQDLSSRLDSSDIKYQRVSAFDGREMQREDLVSYVEDHHKITLAPRVSGGDVGCFLSHYKIWEMIADSDEDYAVVLEDDIHFSTDLNAFINSDSWLPKGFDIVRLEVSTNRVLLSSTHAHTFRDRTVHQLDSTSWCTGGYIMSKACAKKLLSHQLSEYISVDTLLFCLEVSGIAKELEIYQISPALVIQDQYVDNKVGYSSNTEKAGFVKRLKRIVVNNLNLLSISSSLKKTLLGYKRVSFK